MRIGSIVLGMQEAQRKPRSRWVGLVLWGVLLPLVLLVALGWMLSDRVFVIDMMGAAQMHLCWGVLLVLLIGLALRRWRFAACVLVLLGCALYPLLSGRTLMLPKPEITRDNRSIRIVSANINPENESWDDALTRLLEIDADVIVLIEVHPELNRSIKNRGRLDGTDFPYWTQRYWVECQTSACFVISRWPIERLDTGDDPIVSQNALHVLVDGPQGAFVVGLLHPLSPRGNGRWTLGNAVIEMQADAIEDTIKRTKLPMLIGADLNSAPAQYRSRVLREHGLRQSKPLLRMGGSFPINAGIPGPLRVQIDDVWYAPGVRPVAWESIEIIGSDHDGVFAEFMLD